MALQELFMANLRAYRKKSGLTQERLAELCGTDPCYIGQIENGRRFPSVAYIEKLAAALNIAPHRLFYQAEDAALIDAPFLTEARRQTLARSLSEGVERRIREILAESFP